MILSLNEIETTIRRAATGAGWAYGLAEDAGRAAAWLAGRGLDGVGVALASLERGPASVVAARSPAGWHLTGARAAAVGPAGLDLLAASGPGAGVTLEAVDEPLLLVGFAGVAARARGCDFLLECAGMTVAQISGTGVEWRGVLPAGAESLRLLHRPGEVSEGAGAATAGVEVSDALWARALAAAARSYVPASEASRLRGAGAGLTDND